MKLWLMIGTAGALGTLIRYGLDVWFVNRLGRSFPWGTLAVNLLGCLLIGILLHLLHDRFLLSPHWRAALMIGLLGGLTTFSSFGLQTFGFLKDGQVGTALAYVLVSNLSGVLLVWMGYLLARSW
ncbi:MAG TPA: fluoride efflux transporter CrcB [Acidobacteriota bacterium]|nr:fluoride efflux transporter CrcB [Acidobacteriota bacterium]